MVERAKAAIDAATLGAIKPYLDAAARAALDAPGVGELVEALERIVLEAHETIPRDGKNAAFHALETIARIGAAALSRARATQETNSE
jgi:hypothetical protein